MINLVKQYHSLSLILRKTSVKTIPIVSNLKLYIDII